MAATRILSYMSRSRLGWASAQPFEAHGASPLGGICSRPGTDPSLDGAPTLDRQDGKPTFWRCLARHANWCLLESEEEEEAVAAPLRALASDAEEFGRRIARCFAHPNIPAPDEPLPFPRRFYER